ncbi:hypothetical protein IWZ01DRAFT_99791 [Phyllosticta capitalensis]
MNSKAARPSNAHAPPPPLPISPPLSSPHSYLPSHLIARPRSLAHRSFYLSSQSLLIETKPTLHQLLTAIVPCAHTAFHALLSSPHAHGIHCHLPLPVSSFKVHRLALQSDKQRPYRRQPLFFFLPSSGFAVQLTTLSDLLTRSPDASHCCTANCQLFSRSQSTTPPFKRPLTATTPVSQKQQEAGHLRETVLFSQGPLAFAPSLLPTTTPCLVCLAASAGP